MARKKLAVLISGRGSNLQSLIDACQAPDFPAEIVLVLSNVAGVAGLDRATKAGIPAVVVNHKDYPDRATFEEAVHAEISRAKPDLVCLAGFMRILTDGFIKLWNNRLINIHPSLLPAFRGLHTHERVLETGARFAGCTIHFVRPAMDDGPIIVQAAVPVRPGDTPESLGARVLEQEHKIYPLAVRLIAEGRVRVIDERVVIEGATAAEGAVINPAG
ncbi:MAG: phosphoribosylglycinamide formyltransferase [Rhodospirillales bacterium]|jgi:phosphoribosylglycinamide formyltransferase-1|nr:phosphoribosylglycinamide formyltransferase [Rhodospirillales bacterium]